MLFQHFGFNSFFEYPTMLPVDFFSEEVLSSSHFTIYLKHILFPGSTLSGD